ncbi:MAG TPA: hypothetical protein RMH99_16040 [Sandaracinaceae bacterium LLY-WYZ-13_1]|nr:hypothetical protein [Sandaracinaceae bacterium LLY-WYZ-13_1]
METAGCPSCGSREAEGVGFTWWGGVVGPKLLSHVRCAACGATYNAKTGGSNATGIALYLGAVLTLAVIIGLGVALMR